MPSYDLISPMTLFPTLSKLIFFDSVIMTYMVTAEQSLGHLLLLKRR